jgi:hypothetical protein
VQTAGSSGGQTWNNLTVNLTGTIVNTLGPGDVRWSGTSYTDQPKLYDITVVG